MPVELKARCVEYVDGTQSVEQSMGRKMNGREDELYLSSLLTTCSGHGPSRRSGVHTAHQQWGLHMNRHWKPRVHWERRAAHTFGLNDEEEEAEGRTRTRASR